MSKKATITRGPASGYERRGESIYEFSDGQSGGLIAIERDASGRLVVDLYRMDDDVVVRLPGGGAHVYAPQSGEL